MGHIAVMGCVGWLLARRIRHAAQVWVELSFCAWTMRILGGEGAAHGWFFVETRAILPDETLLLIA